MPGEPDCSSCGKAQRRNGVRPVAGPGGVHICDECVQLCADMLDIGAEGTATAD